MKILLINKFHYYRGGSETYYFALADLLRSMGNEVIFFSMKDKRNLSCDQEKYFVSNVDYNSNNPFKKIKGLISFFYSFEAKRKISQLIKKEKPDIAHIGLVNRQLTFSILGPLKRAKIPVVMSMHDLIFACPCYTMLSPHGICQDCITYSTKKCVSYKCVKDSKMMSLLAAKENNFNKRHHFYDKINLFIAENEFYKKLMVTSKFTSSPIISMINFLPLNQVYEISPFHKKYILYFGRFSKEKGILTLLNAFKDLSVDNQLIIVGAGPQEEIIKDYILKERIPNIELPGPIYGQKMEEIIIESEMVVLPSEWYENCPYALLQAMAKGKPVICSNIGGLPEILGPELKELLFEKGNPNDLQKKMSSVLSMSNTEYDFLSHKVLHRAKEISDAESYGRKLMKEYNKLVEKTK